MSIDLEWGKLDSSLSSTLVDILNRQLANTPRPSFIGPVEVTSLDFGSVSPDIELVDLRDIYRDFLEDDDTCSEDNEPVKVTEGAEGDDGFEWVSRKAAGRTSTIGQDLPAYHHLPPHLRYARSMSADIFASMPALSSPMWNGSGSASLADFRPSYVPPSMYHSARSSLPATPFAPTPAPFAFQQSLPRDSQAPPVSPSPSPPPPQKGAEELPEESTRPDLQLHLHITWHSDLRITLTTSLLINYPSPMFMSLPIKLSVIGLLFTGELAVAYEGTRNRVHLCILDELDPYGPAGDRSKRDSSVGDGTPPELDEDAPSHSHARSAKPLPIGQRLLPSIFIESEIGQADKHVLKNVTRVERFIQDVIRKTIEEELVFPNFHTLVMGDS